MATRNCSKFKKKMRISRKPKSCPNPLFERWLQEMKDEAIRKDSRLQHVYSKALKSLQKYPLSLHSGKECKILKNFGSTLCKQLDDKLHQHRASGGSVDIIPADVAAEIIHAEESDEMGVDVPSKQQKKSKSQIESKTTKGSKEYIPTPRSGPYALLVALHESRKPTLTKVELQQAAQPHCDSSFTQTNAQCRYSAWSSISLLLAKELVEKSGRPSKFSLTEKGLELATRLLRVESEMRMETAVNQEYELPRLQMELTNTLLVHRVEEEEEVEEEVDSVDRAVTLVPGDYDIFLCVDSAEVSGSNGMNQKEAASRAFQNCGVLFQVCKLSVGDYLWVCKPKKSSVHVGCDLVLPFVIERKRLDDLAGSIKDGRFKEQKFRLKNCGLQRPIYLIEEHGSRQHAGLPEGNLMQAVANTLLIEKFQVHWTRNSGDSVAFLVQFTKQLSELYRDKTVYSRPVNRKATGLRDLIPLKEFNSASQKQKPLSVTNMFAKQLMQLHGMSADKAEAIVKIYPTPKSFFKALRQADADVTSQLLAGVIYGAKQRKIGSGISQLLTKLYAEDQICN
nr:EOG090X06E6 [Leptodora kindtii]